MDTAFRWIKRFLISALSLGICVCGMIYGNAQFFQHRAEVLDERVRALEIGETEFSGIQRLAADYGRNVWFEDYGCTAKNCGFTIRLMNQPFPAVLDRPLFWKLGVRPTLAAATVRVTQGQLRYASFAISTRTQYGYWLLAAFHAVAHLSMFDRCSRNYLGRHSTYAVKNAHLTSGDGGGQIVETAFAADAAAEQIQKGTNIRISCITAIPSCRTAQDLMPEAAKGFSFEPVHDRLFTEECRKYIEDLEVGPGPWKAETAFDADPTSFKIWMLTRPTD